MMPCQLTVPALLFFSIGAARFAVVRGGGAAAATSSVDTDERCSFWAESGECDANPNYMRTHCVASCDAYDREKADLIGDVVDDDGADYGEGVGVDGEPFHLEAVLARSEAAETCPAPGAPPPIVRLPDNYPAKLTLAAPLAEGAAEPTLDELHAKGRLTYAEYVRPNHEPGTKIKGGAVAVKILNFTRRKFKKMWDDGKSPEGVYNGELPAGLGSRSVLMTYAGHAFKFVDVESGELYRRIVMRDDVHFIIFEPDADDDDARSSEAYAAAKREQRFMRQYHERLGYPWLSKYGRPAPVLNMWPADYLGQTHSIQSNHGRWICDDPSDVAKCGPPADSDPVTYNLTVISHAPSGPRVFVIPDLMSEAECDHIRRLGPDVVHESRVGQGSGGFKSSSRTSSTGWLGRNKSPILDAVHSRFADVLGLADADVSMSGVAEQLQVVRYRTSEQYNPHHDFADSGGRGYGQRFLTLLLYVEVPEKGGHTSFPKAFGGKGLKIKPPSRGGAVLFYSMLPDGNGDDLSLHGGDPVMEGEKWVCNLWVWDPNRHS